MKALSVKALPCLRSINLNPVFKSSILIDLSKLYWPRYEYFVHAKCLKRVWSLNGVGQFFKSQFCVWCTVRKEYDRMWALAIHFNKFSVYFIFLFHISNRINWAAYAQDTSLRKRHNIQDNNYLKCVCGFSFQIHEYYECSARENIMTRIHFKWIKNENKNSK